ncbi:phosphoglycerate dehydrogenase [Pollutimonas thiosulfatoxidans]|nr:phosphoglycerate dehydrogenase [Pollutimonas thiosulfatoxidans]
MIPDVREAILKQFPNAKLRDEIQVLNEEELTEFLKDCDAAIVGLEPLSRKVIEALPNLKAVGKFGVGCNNIDFPALHERGIPFGMQPGVNRLAVAELALGFMISALRWIGPLAYDMRSARRPKQRIGRQLTGRVVGLHGCGHIGKEVVRLLKPFDCQILAHDIVDYRGFYEKEGVEPVSLDELVERSEVLSLHIPLTPETENIYDDAMLARLRPDCVLINTCRGGIVNEDALKRALQSGEIQAACFDAFAEEPPTDDELVGLPGLVGTPHIGASTIEARIAMGLAALKGLTENSVRAPDFQP